MKSWRYQRARDEDLKGGERLGSVRRETGLVSASIGLLWWIWVRLYLKVFHRFTVHGRENLPSTPGFILVSNHSSHLDTLALAAILPLRWNGHVFPVAAGDTFFNRPKTAWFAANFLNALPLWRRKASGHALEDLRERVIAAKDVLILYPEGTRSRDGQMGSFKSGVGRLVAGAEVQVVPVHIQGAYEAFSADRKLPRPSRIVCRVGTPISFGELPDAREGWDTVAQELHRAIKELEA